MPSRPTCRRPFWCWWSPCRGHLITGSRWPWAPFTRGWGGLYIRYNCIARGRGQTTLIVCKWMYGQRTKHTHTPLSTVQKRLEIDIATRKPKGKCKEGFICFVRYSTAFKTLSLSALEIFPICWLTLKQLPYHSWIDEKHFYRPDYWHGLREVFNNKFNAPMVMATINWNPNFRL